MTLEEAKDILKDEEYLNCLSDRMTIGEVTQFEKAINTVLKELEEIEIENENLTLSQLDLTKRNISKDEIREKLKKYKKDYYDTDGYEYVEKFVLQEILGEE